MFDYISMSDVLWALLISAVIVFHEPKVEP